MHRFQIWQGIALLNLLLISPVLANRFQEAWVQNCEHTFADGTNYDLKPLTRTAGRPDYVGKDKNGVLYYINICNNVQEIPKECRALQKDIRSPVYQVVTFPTPYGCPKDRGLSTAALFNIVFFLLVGAYFGGGLAFNVTKYQMPVSVEALPHIEFWRELPELVKEGCMFSWDWLMVVMGKREPRERGAFEWSGL